MKPDTRKHTFKKHMKATGFSVGYYIDGELQKFVSESKPDYIKWCESNTPDIMPYIKPKPPAPLPLEKVKARIQLAIRAKTTELIYAGRDFGGIVIRLDDYRQNDLQALYARAKANRITYPFLVWEGSQDIQLDESALFAMCEGAFDFIYAKRLEGKSILADLENLTEEELRNWSDPRDN